MNPRETLLRAIGDFATARERVAVLIARGGCAEHVDEARSECLRLHVEMLRAIDELERVTGKVEGGEVPDVLVPIASL